LSVAGFGPTEYQITLHHLVKQTGLTEYVSFLGWVPPEEMPELLSKFDVLLVTSTWAEPFSRVVLEGMISGLVVVATSTGGTPEIVSDGENGLHFRPNDPEDLAQNIERLVDNPELYRKLAYAGQQTVIEGFTMKKMMDGIESYLQEVASAIG
jgi:glycosyltransferase involved in cell wall biosynthesis